ncbi:MAG: hypothetical protein ABIJ74_02040 [archaeon]
MKVLIPLLSRKELNEEFIEKAVKGANEIVLLMIIDTVDSNSLKASDISGATHFMEEVKKAVGKKRKKCEDFTEWGETKTKIKNTAIISRTDKIVFFEQDNQWFKELINKLKEEKEIADKIELIKVEPKEPEKEPEKETENKEPFNRKTIADRILKKGFDSLESIKKIRFR